MAAYSATKAFDLILGEALWAENRGRGVDVLAVSPGATDTEFQAVAGEKPHAAVPPDDVVDATVGALGKQPSVIVGTFNALRTFSVRFAPRALIARVTEMVMRPNVPESVR
jgi:short-subunit dehydrogenase